jgi:intracellular septation protein
MNQLLEWAPLLIFFVVFKLYGMYWATGSLMLTSVVAMVVHRSRTGRWKAMHVFTAAVALVLGTATLLLHDKRFIEWKPTVLMGAAALAFLASAVVSDRPLARRMLESVFSEPIELSSHAWNLLNVAWAAWFAALAATNIYIARNFAEGIWVNFKVFGITAGMLVFMIPQVIWLTGKTRAAEAKETA